MVIPVYDIDLELSEDALRRGARGSRHSARLWRQVPSAVGWGTSKTISLRRVFLRRSRKSNAQDISFEHKERIQDRDKARKLPRHVNYYILILT